MNLDIDGQITFISVFFPLILAFPIECISPSSTHSFSFPFVVKNNLISLFVFIIYSSNLNLAQIE